MSLESPSIPWLGTALVAENHALLSSRIAAQLRRWGAREVHVVVTAEQACTLLERFGEAIDLMLCDVYLDDGRCDAVIAEARRSAPRARIVIMTGEASPQERSDLMGSLAPHDFLSKPFSGDFLYDRLVTIDERLASRAAGILYNLALAEGLPEATATARTRVLHKAIDDASGNVSEAARRVRLNRTHMHKLLAERADRGTSLAIERSPEGVQSRDVEE
jgi:DNA-binding NtrC family response regulator